jgi:hypothetical protein
MAFFEAGYYADPYSGGWYYLPAGMYPVGGVGAAASSGPASGVSSGSGSGGSGHAVTVSGGSERGDWKAASK